MKKYLYPAVGAVVLSVLAYMSIGQEKLGAGEIVAKYQSDWQAEVVTVSKKEQMIFPLVRFTNKKTGESFEQTLQGDSITAASLARIAKQKIKSVEARDRSFSEIKVGIINIPAVDDEIPTP